MNRHEPGPHTVTAAGAPPRPAELSPSRLPASSGGLAALAAAFLLLIGTADPAAARGPLGPGWPDGDPHTAPVCRSGLLPAAGAGPTGAAVDPTRVEMAATRRARGGSGTLTLRLSSSPFGVALSENGSYRYYVEVAVEDLPRLREGTYVVWAATPELDRHRKLGALGSSGSVSGEVDWNKFLVFVTAEASADVEAWSQSIVLSARSPSGRMHTMAGHGPFSGEPCPDPRP